VDAFAGMNKKYATMKDVKVITNDIDQKCPTEYHLPADRFLSQMYADARNVDLVDLDPYGSCWDCLPLAIKLARKGLIISYGDFSNWRYKRWEIIQYQVGCIPKDIDQYRGLLIGVTIQMAMSYAKKKLVPVYAFSPNKYFTRIYYQVQPGKWNINNGAEKLRKK
jgi:tRNA G26 N,N-dimethylase Trm1